MKILSVAFALSSLLAACGSKDSDDDDSSGAPSTGAAGEISDTTFEGVVAYLKAGTFREWTTKQPQPIDSATSHGKKTQTFFNDTAAAAAKAGTVPLPKGSVLVKDLFAPDGTTLLGQAIMVKVEDGTSGDTWLWYEGFTPGYAQTHYGKGNPTCTGCHADGSDFVRTAVSTASAVHDL